MMGPGVALILLGTITLLLGLFVVGVVLLARSNRQRMAGGRPPAEVDGPDAWQEAGRRLDPDDPPSNET